MALSKKPVYGMKDILPAEMEIRDYVTNVIKDTYRSFGFTPIETPCMENIANLSNKQATYAIVDNELINWQFYVLNLVVACVVMVLFRYVFKRTFINLTEFGRSENYERTLIVGAGQAAKMILTDINSAHADPNNPSRNILPAFGTMRPVII